MEKINYIIIKIWKLINSFIYAFLKILKTRNKITFISRQTNGENLDFNLIIKELKRQNIDIETVVLNKKIGKNLKSVISYMFHMYKQMYHIATSKTVILDGYCIAISNLKHKKDLKVVQIWHALGALKKFGYSILDQEEGRSTKIAKLMNMHKNYTYILTSSQITKEFFKEAFNAKEEQMVVLGLPRIDFLKSEYYNNLTQNRFFKKYPNMNNSKKNILYVPTKRNTNINKKDLNKIIYSINYEKYNLIIKLHNGSGLLYIDNKFYSKEKDFLGLELLHIADYIITDYSAITYEAAITGKPIYFYAYDYEEYVGNRGFYIDYNTEMPGPISNDINEILKLIDNNVMFNDKTKAFLDKYCPVDLTGLENVTFIINKEKPAYVQRV